MPAAGVEPSKKNTKGMRKSNDTMVTEVVEVEGGHRDLCFLEKIVAAKRSGVEPLGGEAKPGEGQLGGGRESEHHR